MTENWYPSLDVYDPKITEDKWVELLQDREIFNHKSMCFMRRMLDFAEAIERNCIAVIDFFNK